MATELHVCVVKREQGDSTIYITYYDPQDWAFLFNKIYVR